MTTTPTTYTIDAAGKKLGRIASDAASALAGKKSATYRRGAMNGVSVVIKNAGRLDIMPKKRDQKVYQRYTYYPGGLKGDTMDELIARKGIEEVVRKAVYGMLPRTKLRPLMMKLLIVNK
jgi:large subunit ribosomal protein L13